MSRIGNAQITIPDGVTINVAQGGEFNHQLVTVTGPKGELTRSIRRPISVEVADGNITVTRKGESKQAKSFHGLYRALIANMVTGVTDGFKKELQIVGIGFRAELQGEVLVLSLGYSHKIEVPAPAGVTITVPEQDQVVIEGIDNQQVGELAAKIRGMRPPEPYKGKGVRYKDEQVTRKSVKTA